MSDEEYSYYYYYYSDTEDPPEIVPKTRQEETHDFVVKLLSDNKEFVDQFQEALFLNNIRLYYYILILVLGTILVFLLLFASPIPNTIIVIIAYPLLHVLYLEMQSKIKRYYLKEFPKRDNNAPDRLRTIDEIAHYLWIPFYFILLLKDLIYRAIFHPNTKDTLIFIVSAIILGKINRVLSFFTLFCVILVMCLISPPILIRTPVGRKIKKFVTEKKKMKSKSQEF